MNNAVQAITWQGLALASIPTIFVLLLMWRWAAGAGTALYATARMLVQLLLIGYVLVYIFEAGEASIIMAVLGVMLLAASWISIRPVANKSRRVYGHALLSIAVSGVLTLALVSQAVIGVEPWFSPRYVVPLGGMVITGAMNAVSLAAERFQSETARDEPVPEARRSAFKTSLIPITNMLFAVGVVSLPGMMTGQILSGVSPLIAAKYQIIIMAMFFGTGGIAAAIYLELESRRAGGD